MIAESDKWAVVHDESVALLIELREGQHLATGKTVETFDDRPAAVARILEIDPEWAEDDEAEDDEDGKEDAGPAHPSHSFTRKTDIARRLEPDEAKTLRRRMRDLEDENPKLLLLWDSVTEIPHLAPEWATLVEEFTTLFSEPRALQLLAESD